MLELDSEKKLVGNSPLGKNSEYVTQYNPDLLFPIPRIGKRNEIQVPEKLPFTGVDIWNAYEVSWLNAKGKPVVAIVQFDIDCNSKNILESKSFKLYLNSFNSTQVESLYKLQAILERDVKNAVEGEVRVSIFQMDDFLDQKIETFDGECLDSLDVICDTYLINPDFLTVNPALIVEESLYSHLLKSNCLVTGQPDWGSVQIKYRGPKIDREGLLKYIVSFRDHNEFHEQCVERIFMDILNFCKPDELTVSARYTRRGGLDINPIRSTQPDNIIKNIRMARQ